MAAINLNDLNLSITHSDFKRLARLEKARFMAAVGSGGLSNVWAKHC
jgi:hypothetical protein